MAHPASIPPPKTGRDRKAFIKPNATYQDVLDAPEGAIAELLNGTLHVQPRPASPHAFAHSVLSAEIVGPFGRGRGGPGGWWIIFEPELHLGGHVLVPDIAGWRRENMPNYPDTAAFTQTPDWICEVLSPSTRTYDLTEKRAIYAEQGVSQLWLVDPQARTLEAFALETDGWRLIAALRDDQNVRVAPFDAIIFPLSALWPS